MINEVVRAKNAHTEISEGMTFKKTEKEIIKAIVKYGGEVKSLVDVLNESKILEKRGIAIVPCPNDKLCYIFLHKDKFSEDDMDEKRGLDYVVEIVSLIQLLIEKRLIVIIPYRYRPSLVIGKPNASWYKPEVISIDNGNEFITLGYRNVNWLNAEGKQIAWTKFCSDDELPMTKLITPWFTVSQELVNLVKNNFKTEEEIRFRKQQVLTWISIVLATIIGLLGILI